MSAIGAGSRVKCIKQDEWRRLHSREVMRGPQFGSVWTVEEVHYENDDGRVWVKLVEWAAPFALWDIDCFRPLNGDAELERLKAIAKFPNPIDLPSREVVHA